MEGEYREIVLPKSYEFKPQEDITAFELAQCMTYLIHGNGLLLQQEDDSVKRHFKDV